MGGKIEVFNADRGTDYFFMFVNLLRVLYKLDSDAGYVKQTLPQLEPEEKLQILRCDTEMVAFGTSQRRVVLVDADTFGEESLSVWRGSSPSCLASTHDFVIIGTFFGEVKIWSPHNEAHHLQELTGHTNVVTSVAVHSSHHYILSASSSDSCSVRLHCPFDMSVWKISLSPPASVLTDHVFHIEFLPDPSPATFQFLFGTSICVGVITVSKKEDFGVLEQHYRGPVMKYLSFATVRSDPTLLYLTSYEGTTDKPGPCLIKRLRVKGNGFCEEIVVHQSPKFRQDYRILAAGKRFLLLINYRGDFKMFDTVRSEYICHFHCRPAPIPVVGLSSLLKTSCVGQSDCLDGLCPESMQPGHKVLMTAGEPGIVAWQWSENLWGDVCWHSGDVILC